MKRKPLTAASLRRRAEAKIGTSPKRKPAHPRSEAETQRLVHELQVHQLELEMQNQELVQARAELETALRQYADLYELAPAGYFTLGRDGAVRRANLTGARLLGVDRSRLLLRRFAVFVAAGSRRNFAAVLKRVFASRGRDTCELELLQEGKEPFWAHLEFIADDAEECRTVVVDITASKRAEEQMRSLSIRDSLTGLYNRSFFEAEFSRLERGRHFPISLMMADVNGLKQVNDHQGHAAGDDVLIRAARALAVAFRAEDVVARLGGDEFAVLLPGSDAAAAELALRRVREVLDRQNSVHAGAPVRLAFGVSTAETPAPWPDLLKDADANMYVDKRRYAASAQSGNTDSDPSSP